jgi:uncharacterized membrane-anchored protein
MNSDAPLEGQSSKEPLIPEGDILAKTEVSLFNDSEQTRGSTNSPADESNKPLTKEAKKSQSFLKTKNARMVLCSLTEFLFVFSYFSLIQILPMDVQGKGITDWMIGLIQGSVGGIAIASSFFYLPLCRIWQQKTFIFVSLLLTVFSYFFFLLLFIFRLFAM